MQAHLLCERVLAFVRELCAADGLQVALDADTALLDERRIVDSKRMVDLLAFVERATGAPVPDRLLSGEHFGSAAAIARTFGDDGAAQRGAR
jgi:hypothetical protein